MREYYLSCSKFTIWVRVGNSRKITDIAPMARKFKGQHINNLIVWMRKLGGFEWKQLA